MVIGLNIIVSRRFLLGFHHIGKVGLQACKLLLQFSYLILVGVISLTKEICLFEGGIGNLPYGWAFSLSRASI